MHFQPAKGAGDVWRVGLASEVVQEESENIGEEGVAASRTC